MEKSEMSAQHENSPETLRGRDERWGVATILLYSYSRFECARKMCGARCYQSGGTDVFNPALSKFHKPSL
jgi:hypothetical protein